MGKELWKKSENNFDYNLPPQASNAAYCCGKSQTNFSAFPNVTVFSFTQKGYALAVKVKDALNAREYVSTIIESPKLSEAVPPVFKKGNKLVFIGAAAIAVRAISPLLKDKTRDPAVVVIDELGRYVIPILSGHLGGANLFAEELAKAINATPIITTATDINKVFSVDGFAVKYRYVLENPENIKYISSALLNGRKVGFSASFPVSGSLPENVEAGTDFNEGIYIGDKNISVFPKTVTLMPKRFHVGIGARKGISFEALHAFFLEVLDTAAISASCVATVSSIDLKKNEEAIIRLASLYSIDFLTYTAEQLKDYESQFAQSAFVKDKTGVGNVCETCAFLSSGKGELAVFKTSKDGMTIAVAKEAWRVAFENLHDRN